MSLVTKISLSILCLTMLTGCFAKHLKPAEIVGRWTYGDRGDGKPVAEEVTSGRIEFKPDGTFDVHRASGIVSRVDDARADDRRGTWSIETRGWKLFTIYSDRPAIKLSYEDENIPFDAFYSEYQGKVYLKFVRDEEAGGWVEYRKVE